MNTETVNAIKDALAPIAAKIGQGAEYGWDVVVRQQYINGVLNIAYSIMGLVYLLVYIPYLFRAIKRDKESEMFPIMVGGVIGIFALLALIIDLGNGVQHLLNPAYYALDFFTHLGSGSMN